MPANAIKAVFGKRIWYTIVANVRDQSASSCSPGNRSNSIRPRSGKGIEIGPTATLTNNITINADPDHIQGKKRLTPCDFTDSGNAFALESPMFIQRAPGESLAPFLQVLPPAAVRGDRPNSCRFHRHAHQRQQRSPPNLNDPKRILPSSEPMLLHRR